MEVGIREFRNHLSRWLDAVQDGKDVLITDRGKAIARVSKVDRPKALDRLIAAGAITPARQPRSPVRLDDLVEAQGSVSQFALEQRQR